MTLKLYSGRPSVGAQELAGALGIRRIRPAGSRWTPRRGDMVINWGNSTVPDFAPASIINQPEAIRRSANKLHFFQGLDNFEAEYAGEPVRVPTWTTDRAVAATWFDREDSKVMCRTVLTGHSGHGIIVAEVEDELVQAPLYTRYVKKQAEYRVHIMRGRIIDVQRKIRDPNREPTNWQIRSHQNGFIFVRENVELPVDAQTQSVRAFRASGLDFGAVDVITDRNGLGYVLEINTAPGLTGQTVMNYADAFRQEFMG